MPRRAHLLTPSADACGDSTTESDVRRPEGLPGLRSRRGCETAVRTWTRTRRCWESATVERCLVALGLRKRLSLWGKVRGLPIRGCPDLRRSLNKMAAYPRVGVFALAALFALFGFGCQLIPSVTSETSSSVHRANMVSADEIALIVDLDRDQRPTAPGHFRGKLVAEGRTTIQLIVRVSQTQTSPNQTILKIVPADGGPFATGSFLLTIEDHEKILFESHLRIGRDLIILPLVYLNV